MYYASSIFTKYVSYNRIEMLLKYSHMTSPTLTTTTINILWQTHLFDLNYCKNNLYLQIFVLLMRKMHLFTWYIYIYIYYIHTELFLGFGLHMSIAPLGLNFMGLFEIPWDIWWTKMKWFVNSGSHIVLQINIPYFRWINYLFVWLLSKKSKLSMLC